MVTVKISEVKPNPNNPRIIKDDKFAKLVKSIKDFPEMLNLRPILPTHEGGYRNSLIFYPLKAFVDLK